MTTNEEKNRTLTIRKVIHAPVALVWQAWIEPEHILQWWAPPGMKVDMVSHDFRVGGRWEYSMPMPDGKLFVSAGTYLEIEEHKKIVTSADFKPMTEGVELRVEFEANGGQTNFTFSVLHATEAYCKQQEQMGFYNGWGSAFERMVKVIEQLRGS